MRYHNITTDDMLNGEGLRTVLWLSGCNHYCDGCHNKITWDYEQGLEVTESTYLELIKKLSNKYISGLTLSGGDPLYEKNRSETFKLCKFVKSIYPNKTIWLYSGYKYEDIFNLSYGREILSYIDVLVDGKFEQDKADVKYKYAGSTNQRVIDVKASLREGKVVLLYET